MKLRNKKTGEIREAADVIIENLKKNGSTLNAISIDEVRNEWEDYEEPKDYWYLNCDGEVIRAVYKTDDLTRSFIAIGNYFETPEEAEKAVEKLRAYKRLKDKGFEAVSSSICGSEFVANFKLVDKEDYSQSTNDFDCILDLGGEE